MSTLTLTHEEYMALASAVAYAETMYEQDEPDEAEQAALQSAWRKVHAAATAVDVAHLKPGDRITATYRGRRVDGTVRTPGRWKDALVLEIEGLTQGEFPVLRWRGGTQHNNGLSDLRRMP